MQDGRDALYYARAIQEPTPAINGDTLRAERDADGKVVSVDPCFGDYRTDPDEQCLGQAGERAWSSPIFVNVAAPAEATDASPERLARSASSR